jgi:hypothetical protein
LNHRFKGSPGITENWLTAINSNIYSKLLGFEDKIFSVIFLIKNKKSIMGTDVVQVAQM